MDEVMERKCYRLNQVEIPFEELKAGDLFILEDDKEDKPRVEDGTVINLALGHPYTKYGVLGIEVQEVSKAYADIGRKESVKTDA